MSTHADADAQGRPMEGGGTRPGASSRLRPQSCTRTHAQSSYSAALPPRLLSLLLLLCYFSRAVHAQALTELQWEAAQPDKCGFSRDCRRACPASSLLGNVPDVGEEHDASDRCVQSATCDV